MSNNTTTDGEFVTEPPAETFHIYILSFSYGFLLLVIFGHLIVRWKWRRVKVSHFPSHYPGDKSFRCKAIRQRLCTDFATISTLSPDPKLINEDYEPKMFGYCKDGESLPGHWYRMKACQAAATFVVTVTNSLATPTTSTLSPSHRPYKTKTAPVVIATTSPSHRPSRIKPLPDVLVDLQQSGSLQVNTQEEERIVERSCDLYALARFKDGIFPKSMFEELSQCLRQLKNMLKSDSRFPGGANTGAAVREFTFPDPNASLTSSSYQLQYGLDPVEHRRMSQEPLLALSSLRSEDTSIIEPPPPPPQQQATPSRSRSRKGSNKQELSPLIIVESPSSAPENSFMAETPV